MLRLAEVKDSLDIDVKQNFIDPLQTVADKDIKDIQVSQTGQDARKEIQKCHQKESKVGFFFSIIWRSWRADAWTTITRRSVRVKSRMRRSDRLWRSSTSLKNWLRAPCTTCWKRTWVTRRLSLTVNNRRLRVLRCEFTLVRYTCTLSAVQLHGCPTTFHPQGQSVCQLPQWVFSST